MVSATTRYSRHNPRPDRRGNGAGTEERHQPPRHCPAAAQAATGDAVLTPPDRPWEAGQRPALPKKPMPHAHDHCNHLPGEACSADHDNPPRLVPPPLSLYVHLPWCVRKCPYCDFNSHQAKGELPFDAYIDALLRDLDQTCRWSGAGWCTACSSVAARPACSRRRRSTASCSRPARACALPPTPKSPRNQPGHRRAWPLRPLPRGRRQPPQLRHPEFRRCDAQAPGRIHDSGEAERAVKMAQDAGYDNFNIDLMYALPEQTLAGAEADWNARSRCSRHTSPTTS